jgi:hypothetical protein
MITLNGASQRTDGLAQIASGTYKRLEFPFRKNGFEHELLERRGLTCLVQRTSVAYGHSHYEVVQLQLAEERQFPNGIIAPASECYPSSSEWGIYGFTYRTLDEARKRFEKLAPTRSLAKQRGRLDAPIIKTARSREVQAGLSQFLLNF